MKRTIFSLVLAVMTAGSSFAQADQKEIAAVAQTVSYYLDGGTFAGSLQFSKAFSPQGQMLYMQNDTMRIVSLKDFMARARNTGQKTNRKTRIDNIQVFGNAAQAKLTIEYETFYFHDMMSLLKTKDGWKIVSKIFYREDKPKK
jgi:hypothetical protein